MTWHMPWVEEAVCSQTDPEIFHPAKGESRRAAVKICQSCPVIAECLNWALQHKETGIWGGTSENQRKQLRRELGIQLKSGWTALLERTAG